MIKPERWPVILKTHLAGIGLGAIYWLLVSLLYAFIFREGDFLEGLLPSDSFNLWERLLATFLLLGVHISMHYATYGHRVIRQKLSASEAKYRTLFETMAQGVVYHDSQGKVISANPSAINILGFTVEEMSSHTVLEAGWKAVREDGSEFPAIDHPALVALRTGKEIKNVVMGVFNPLEKKTRWISVTATPQFNENSSRPYQVFTTFNDISIAVEMENKIRESEEFSRSLLENAPIPITVLNPDGSLRYVNPAFEELTGYRMQEIIGCTIPFPWWPEAIAKQYMAEDKARGFKDLTSDVRRYRKKNGEYFWIIISVRNVKKNGQFKYFLTTWLDITQRVKSEEALQQSEQKLKKVFESVADGIVITDTSGQIIESNDNALNLLRYPSKTELMTHNLADLISDYDRSNALQNLLNISDGSVTNNLNCTYQRKDQTTFAAEVSSRLARDSSGKALFVVVSFRDITERKAMEDRIVELYHKEKEQRQELQEEARVRGLFIDILAHELKNPLTPILISSNLLKKSLQETGNIKAKLVDNILISAEALSTRLEELLDLARFSRGQVDLNKQIMDLRTFLEEVAARFSPGLSRSRQQLLVDLPSDLSTVEIDPSRMEQVLINLLSNASKFSTAEGRIELKARTEGKRIIIEVRDEGIGISEEDQERIFKPYHRVKQDHEKIPGLGLGLAVSKHIVEAHGGKIRVYSRLGHGSTFSIELPGPGNSA